jgi:hypothetical protein
MICNLHEVQNEIHKFLKMDRREKEKKKKNRPQHKNGDDVNF